MVVLLGTAVQRLHHVEQRSIEQGRKNRLATYNDYREAMKFPRVTRFEQISGDPQVVQGLKKVYGDVGKIEFFVGLFAEESRPRSAVPSLIGRMVAVAYVRRLARLDRRVVPRQSRLVGAAEAQGRTLIPSQRPQGIVHR